MLLLHWAILFFIVAVAAGVFGFTNISVASAKIARLIFFVFVVLFIASLVMHFIGS